MFNVGDRVRIVKKLPPSTNKKHIVHEKLGCECVIKEKDTLGAADWWVSPVDKSISTFWVLEEWIEPYKEEQLGCTCDINVLMYSGCKCGQIQREKGNA